MEATQPAANGEAATAADAKLLDDVLETTQRQLAQTRARIDLARANMELVRLERVAERSHIDREMWFRPMSDGEAREAARFLEQGWFRKRQQQDRTGARPLTEGSLDWDYLNTYSDLIDRLRQPDGVLLTPISTAYDRRYGANWPFWRTWQDHAKIRGASRILCGMSPQAQGALGGLAAYVVGPGTTFRTISRRRRDPAPVPLLEALQDVLDEFSDHNQFPALETEHFVRKRRDGEAYLRYFAGEDGRTDVRTVEPEHVIECAQARADGSGAEDIWQRWEYLGEYSFGVITPADDYQTRLGYVVSYDGTPGTAEFVSAAEMQQSIINVDRQVKRGCPDFAFDLYDLLKTVSRALDNMGNATAVHSAIAMIVQHEKQLSGDVQALIGQNADYTVPNPFTGANDSVQRVQKGTRYDVPKGMSWVDPPFGRANTNYIEVVQLVSRCCAVKWNAPEWLINGDTSNNAYASAVVGESPFVKRCENFQHGNTTEHRQTMWVVLKNHCAANGGGIKAGGTFYPWQRIRELVDIQAEPPAIVGRKPLEEAQADQTYNSMGVKSAQTISQERGLDYEQEQLNFEEHRERTGGAGQPLPLPGSDDGKGGTGDRPAPFREGVQAPTLDVPHVPQQGDYDCGAAAFRAVCRYYGVGPDDPAEFLRLLEVSPAAGTSPEKIVAASGRVGLQTWHGPLSLTGLATAVQDGRCVLCPVQMYGTPGQYDTSQAGHWVVVIGCTADAVTIEDPAYGRRTLPAAEFEARWRDKAADGTVYDHYGIAVRKG